MGKRSEQAVLVFAVGFAQLALGAVAVNGVAQLALRHAEQHFDLRPCLVVNNAIDQAQRVGCGRL